MTHFNGNLIDVMVLFLGERSLLGLSINVLVKQALSFSTKDFSTLESAISYLIAKAPITAALVTSCIVLYKFSRYCVDIIRDIGNQSLELTKFSVIAKQIVDSSSENDPDQYSIEQQNRQKSLVIGELMAKKWNSEPLAETAIEGDKKED